MFGGFYIVPLYALIQSRTALEERSRVVAANNILNALFMVISAIFSIVLLTVANLRGVRETGRIFAVPTYLFFVTVMAMLIVGLVRMMT